MSSDILAGIVALLMPVTGSFKTLQAHVPGRHAPAAATATQKPSPAPKKEDRRLAKSPAPANPAAAPLP